MNPHCHGNTVHPQSSAEGLAGVQCSIPVEQSWSPPTLRSAEESTAAWPAHTDDSDGEDNGRFSMISKTVMNCTGAAAKAAVAAPVVTPKCLPAGKRSNQQLQQQRMIWQHDKQSVLLEFAGAKSCSKWVNSNEHEWLLGATARKHVILSARATMLQCHMWCNAMLMSIVGEKLETHMAIQLQN